MPFYQVRLDCIAALSLYCLDSNQPLCYHCKSVVDHLPNKQCVVGSSLTLISSSFFIFDGKNIQVSCIIHFYLCQSNNFLVLAIVCMCMRVYVHVCACVHVCMHVHAHMYIYTFVHVYVFVCFSV